MSEQNASTAQAYAIAARFSERARRAAAEAEYEPIPYMDPGMGHTLRRSTTNSGCYCPLGIMLEADGKIPTNGHASTRSNYTQPSPEDVAQLLTGVGIYHIFLPEEVSTKRLALARTIRDEAQAFTRDWDRGNLPTEQLAAALGLVPPSADATTDGD